MSAKTKKLNRKTKESLKPFLPSFLLKWYHKVRLSIFGAKKAAHRSRNKGTGLSCNFCEQSSKSFLEDGIDLPIIEEWEIHCAGKRSNALCPNCESKDRERTLLFFLEEMTDLFEQEYPKILHIAPEKELKKVFKEEFKDSYTNADLNPELADVELDITKISYPKEKFDVVICNHVLEHIPEDIQAMTELNRILKPNGFAILQVPISFKTAKTIEDFSITSPEDREKAFGQFDHVRIYGRDYVNRLELAGWEVQLYYPEDFLSKEEIREYALIPQEPIFYCQKPLKQLAAK